MAIGAATEQVILQIIGDVKSGEDAIKRIGKVWSDLGRSLRSDRDAIKGMGDALGGLDTQAKKLLPTIDQLGKAGKTLGTIFGAISAAGTALIGSTARVAMRNEVLALSMNVVGENTGHSAEELARYEEQLKSLGITTSKARVALNRFMQGELELGDAVRLSNVARNLAVVSGSNTSEAFGKLTDAVISMNPRLLREFGIVTTLNQALGDLSDSTDVAAKRQRMLDFVVEQGASVAGVYESAMSLVGKRITSIPRLIEELQASFGAHFLPVIGKGVDIVSSLLKMFQALPEGVQGAIAKFILVGTALSMLLTVGAGLLALLPAIAAGWAALTAAIAPLAATVGPVLAPILIVVALIGVAIAGLVGVVLLLRKAWETNFGGIQDSVARLWANIKPRLDQLRSLWDRWAGHLGLQVKNIISLIGQLARQVADLLEPAFNKIGQLFAGLEVGGAFDTIMDTMNVFLGWVSAWLDVLARLLRGEGFASFRGLEDAAINGLTLVALIFEKYVSKAKNWGWNLVVNVANGITRAVQSVLVRAANLIGQVLARFLAPGSPPQEGPLSHIVEWGKGLMETYARSFGLADFSILRDSLAPIRTALESALSVGDLDEEGFVALFGRVREQVAGLIATFRETGEIGEAALAGIGEALGEGSDDLVAFLRLQLEHQQALENLADIQAEVAEAEAAGFIPQDLKDKLSAAEETAEQARSAVEWQREFLALQQEGVDLQARLASTLDRLAGAMESLAGGTEGAGAGAGGGLAEALGIDDLGGVEDGLGGIQVRLGEMSDEFLEMRGRVVEWIERFKEFVELPIADKLLLIAQYLSDATGIDFVGFLTDIFDVASEINEKGLLAVVVNWISAGLDYIEENYEQWIEDVAEWLVAWFAGSIEMTDERKDEFSSALQALIAGIIDAFLTLLRGDMAGYVTRLFAWWLVLIVSWLTRLNELKEQFANALKEWLGSIVVSFVAKAVAAATEWLAGLDAIGDRIVERIEQGLTDAWDMIDFLGGKLSSLAGAILEGGWLDSLLDVGGAMIDKIKSGILARWDDLVTWWQNLLAGLGLPEFDVMIKPDVRGAARGALRTELSATQRAMARGVAGMGGGLTQQFGDLNFPGVRTMSEADLVRRGLSKQARAVAMAGKTSGIL